MRAQSGLERYETVRVREADHRYRNTLQLLGSLTRMKSREATCAEAREALLYVNELVEILGRLQPDLDGHDSLDLCAQMKVFARHWQRLCNGQIEITVESSGVLQLSAAQFAPISLIAHELVLNAIRHAFPDGRHGTIRISVQRDGPRHAVITVRDDGIGAAPEPVCLETLPGHHQGQRLIADLAAALGGTVRCGSTNGAGYTTVVRWLY